MNILCDDAVVANLLRGVHDEVKRAGAKLHPDLIIHQHGTDMWAACGMPDQPGEPLIQLPAEVLIPINDLQWDEKRDLTPVRGLEWLTNCQRRLLDGMLALYEATDKINHIHSRLPTLALRDWPELAAYLARAWPGWGKHRATLSPTQALVKTRAVGITDLSGGTRRLWLMPLIDVFNHHPDGARFDTSGGGVAIADRRTEGSDECFACYGFRDTMSLLLNYGYVDPRPGFVQSVACRVALDEHRHLHITGQHGSRKNDLPIVDINTDGDVTLSHFNLAAKNMAHSLTVLVLLLRRRSPETPRARLDAHAVALYEAIRLANVEHYQGLLDRVGNLASPDKAPLIADMLTETARHQLIVLDEIHEALARHRADAA